MAQISLDNGHSFMTAVEAMPEILERNRWNVVINYMDRALEEDLNAEMAPCTELEFLTAYLARAEQDLVIG